MRSFIFAQCAPPSPERYRPVMGDLRSRRVSLGEFRRIAPSIRAYTTRPLLDSAIPMRPFSPSGNPLPFISRQLAPPSALLQSAEPRPPDFTYVGVRRNS